MSQLWSTKFSNISMCCIGCTICGSGYDYLDMSIWIKCKKSNHFFIFIFSIRVFYWIWSGNFIKRKRLSVCNGDITPLFPSHARAYPCVRVRARAKPSVTQCGYGLLCLSRNFSINILRLWSSLYGPRVDQCCIESCIYYVYTKCVRQYLPACGPTISPWKKVDRREIVAIIYYSYYRKYVIFWENIINKNKKYVYYVLDIFVKNLYNE